MIGAVSSATLLDVWEQGYSCSPVTQGLLLLRLAWPDQTPQALQHLSIGDRDRVLFSLRRQMFGSTIHSLSVCPDCAHALEIEFDLGPLFDADTTTNTRIHHQQGETVWSLRLPNSGDLLELQPTLAQTGVPVDALTTQRTLLAACLITPEESSLIQELSEEQVSELSAQMAEADPLCDLSLPVECESCQTAWDSPFDIVSFLWTEIDRACRRLMIEVHRLAAAYGWTEQEILNLSPWRRHLYLEMARG